MRLGWSNEEIFNSCKIDPWFLSEMRGIVDMEAKVKANGLPPNAFGMRTLKAMGFSDARLAVLAETTEADVTAKRHALGVRPGVQAHRHLRGGIRLAHRLHVFDLRGAVRRRHRRRERAVRQEEGRHPRRRSEPHRPGHRIRLLLLPRLLRAGRRRLRDHHGQLQSGDGVDRLRHRRTGSISSRSPPRTCWRSSRKSAATARCTA